MKNRRGLSRRSFLRGTLAGATVTLALPPLEAMLRPNGARADGGDGPFFGLFYWANGTPWNAKHGAEHAAYADVWTPPTTGAGFTPSEMLAPLARHSVSIATGLEPHTEVPASPGGQSDGHMRGFMVALTGDRPRPEGFDHASHTLTALRPSLDQYIARHESFYTAPARFRTIEVGVSEARFHEYGHWNAISYNGPDSQNLPIMKPSELFDLLFTAPADVGELSRRSLVLDAVLEDARSLEARLGARDRERLESHLDHIADIQRRFDSSSVVCEAPLRPSDSGDLHQNTRAMAELLALAVKCGLTRSFSFMLTSPATTHIFSNLAVADGMHKVCHDGAWENVRRITLHQMEAFAIFLDVFAGVTLPGGGTLLDEACILGTSEYGEGWKHSVKELPVIFAGGAGGALARGVHVREAGGNVAKAHLTVLRALGLPETSWGWNGGETSDVLSGILV